MGMRKDSELCGRVGKRIELKVNKQVRRNGRGEVAGTTPRTIQMDAFFS